MPTSQNIVLVSILTGLCSVSEQMTLHFYRGPDAGAVVDQEDAELTPSATNQAGSLWLSKGTEIVAARQARQEVLLTCHYPMLCTCCVTASIQENISIAFQNSVAYANGVAYRGHGQIYMYDGRSQPLPCDVRTVTTSTLNSMSRCIH